MAAKRSPLHGPFTVVGIGELLWDIFPDGRRELGGAVANLAYHASLLGDRGVLASRVGRDAGGDDLVARLRALGVDGRYLQRDADHPTGTVDVALHDGLPSYTIHEQVAFDYAQLDRGWRELAARTDAVTFGTLAQRTPGAAQTIGAFVAACPPHCVRLFDVNLRQRFWSAQVLDASLDAATAVKLNDEELPLVAGALGMPAGDEPAMLAALLERYRLRVACLTRGARGCLLVGAPARGVGAGVPGGASEAGGPAHAIASGAVRRTEQPGIHVPVADTVGAGDAFAAALLYHVLRGGNLQRTAVAANRYAAFVATRRGATPAVPEPVLHEARTAG
ncbi:MAG: PfkB family carbohydrate kinase [Spirochaetaceae bacterium]|nr:PfkB family carbohydrate kinase [Spirochaetaceae bacterium]